MNTEHPPVSKSLCLPQACHCLSAPQAGLLSSACFVLLGLPGAGGHGMSMAQCMAVPKWAPSAVRDPSNPTALLIRPKKILLCPNSRCWKLLDDMGSLAALVQLYELLICKKDNGFGNSCQYHWSCGKGSVCAEGSDPALCCCCLTMARFESWAQHNELSPKRFWNNFKSHLQLFEYFISKHMHTISCIIWICLEGLAPFVNKTTECCMEGCSHHIFITTTAQKACRKTHKGWG